MEVSGSGGTDRQTEALASLAEDQGLVSSNPHGMSELPQSNSMGSDNLFWPPKVPNKHTMCIHTCKQTHTKFIMEGTDVCFTYCVSNYVSANILVYVYAYIFSPKQLYPYGKVKGGLLLIYLATLLTTSPDCKYLELAFKR